MVLSWTEGGKRKTATRHNKAVGCEVIHLEETWKLSKWSSRHREKDKLEGGILW